MALLNPRGVTITPERKTTDFGERDWADIEPIEDAVFDLDEPKPVGESGYMQTGTLFVPRGSDLKDGDRVTYQDQKFGVIGNAQRDMNHPFTGDDFGVVYYAIRTGG